MKIHDGPSGREVISLQKVGSLLGILDESEAKKLSARWHHQDLVRFARVEYYSINEKLYWRSNSC
jgi:hypothetical protein